MIGQKLADGVVLLDKLTADTRSNAQQMKHRNHCYFTVELPYFKENATNSWNQIRQRHVDGR